MGTDSSTTQPAAAPLRMTRFLGSAVKYRRRRKIYESNRGAMGAPPVADTATRASGSGR